MRAGGSFVFGGLAFVLEFLCHSLLNPQAVGDCLDGMACDVLTFRPQVSCAHRVTPKMSAKARKPSKKADTAAAASGAASAAASSLSVEKACLCHNSGPELCPFCAVPPAELLLGLKPKEHDRFAAFANSSLSVSANSVRFRWILLWRHCDLQFMALAGLRLLLSLGNRLGCAVARRPVRHFCFSCGH